MTPEEIKAVRISLAMTQTEFANLTGIGEATISRWERGRLLQNRANDRYLCLLHAAPENIQRLERLRDEVANHLRLAASKPG